MGYGYHKCEIGVYSENPFYSSANENLEDVWTEPQNQTEPNYRFSSILKFNFYSVWIFKNRSVSAQFGSGSELNWKTPTPKQNYEIRLIKVMGPLLVVNTI